MKIMRILVALALFLICSVGNIFAQDITEVIRTVKKRVALKESPNNSSRTLVDIPAITYLPLWEDDKNDKYDVVDTEGGMWRKVYYKGTFGYVFDAKLEHEEYPPLTEDNLYEIFAPIYLTGAKGAPLLDKKEKGKTIMTIPAGKPVYAYAKYDIFETSFEEDFIKVLYEDKIGYISTKNMESVVVLYKIEQPLEFNLD